MVQNISPTTSVTPKTTTVLANTTNTIPPQKYTGFNHIELKDNEGHDVIILQPQTQKPSTDKKNKIVDLAITVAFFAGIPLLIKKFSTKGVGEMQEIAPRVKNLFEDLTSAKKLEEMALPDTLIEMTKKIKKGIDSPSVVKDRGGRPLKSILLYGPPGTGKTTFAKAIAKMFPDSEFANVDVTRLTSAYVGETEKNFQKAINEICQKAEKSPDKKFFIFIDEIDSVMMEDKGNLQKHSQDVLNEFKRCFSERLARHDNIITIGATNLDINPDALVDTGKKLDKPMLDRFDEKILVDLPTPKQLVQAISAHYKGKTLVDSEFTNPDSEKLKILCEFLGDKKHKVSFRTLESIYSDAAVSIENDKSEVCFQDLFNTIARKSGEISASPNELSELAVKLGIKFDSSLCTLDQKSASSIRRIGF